MLEDRGVRACLVNARHMKNVPGRRTDWHECQWIQCLDFQNRPIATIARAASEVPRGSGVGVPTKPIVLPGSTKKPTIWPLSLIPLTVVAVDPGGSTER